LSNEIEIARSCVAFSDPSGAGISLTPDLYICAIRCAPEAGRPMGTRGTLTMQSAANVAYQDEIVVPLGAGAIAERTKTLEQ
jgi:hypothetical protein